MSEDDCFWIFDTISFAQRLNELNIKYQYYPSQQKSTHSNKKYANVTTLIIR